MSKITSIEDLKAALAALPAPNQEAKIQAEARNGQLTKPPGALGRLEEISIWYAAWRGDAAPVVNNPQVAVFAGNHGVTAQGVSAFPAEVTAQMVMNFEHGGAAINQLCRAADAALTVRALDLDSPTTDFTTGPAMDEAAFLAAFNTGVEAVDPSADLFVPGEMGIGNTTCGAAIGYALFGGTAQDWVGRGTGVDDAGLKRKAEVVAQGLMANPNAKGNGLEALRCLGGRELAAMAGAIMSARRHSIPVILDGFICTAAAACLEQAQTGALDHCMISHKSKEAGHQAFCKALGKDPILDLGMRLGEGSGGALAINIVRSALACHSGMATFADAGVSEG
ncbi:MAG: nicotinate-nucleotide--dimethylbenzimidazole phosphoribosyltransferase [Pseudomonadota bacterium]